MNKIIIVGNLSENYMQDSVISPKGICPTLMARDYKGAKKILIKINNGEKKYDKRYKRK